MKLNSFSLLLCGPVKDIVVLEISVFITTWSSQSSCNGLLLLSKPLIDSFLEQVGHTAAVEGGVLWLFLGLLSICRNKNEMKRNKTYTCVFLFGFTCQSSTNPTPSPSYILLDISLILSLLGTAVLHIHFQSCGFRMS
jgi:hypothetical protein